MAEGAAFYFNMTGFNKAAITPDFAARHVAYTLNRNKTVEVGSQNAPASYNEAQEWLTELYRTGRRNARVWTRFILNLPYDLTHQQRVELVREYLHRLSRGRAQFLWAIHGDTDAPHAHVIYVDRDVETGKRVARLSEVGSAALWRTVWEDCCNRALEWAGSRYRVSRWGKHSEHYRNLNDAAAVEHAKRVLAADTALSPAVVEPSAAPPVTSDRHQMHPDPNAAAGLHEEARGDSSTGQEQAVMDAIIKQDAQTPSISAVVAFVASQVVELERLRAVRQTIADYRATYASVTAALLRTQSRLDGLDLELQRAGAKMIKAEQEEAKHKGLAQRLWQIVSPTARARAKAAKTASNMALYSLSTTQIKGNTLMREAKALQAEQTSLHEKANALKSSLAIYGSDEDLDEAEKTLLRTISVNIAELTAMELSEALLAGQITPDEHRQLMRAIDRGKGGVEI